MNVAQLLERSAVDFPDRTVLGSGSRRLSYRELDRQTAALAAGLAGPGPAPGACVGLHLPNWPEVVLTCYAAQEAGRVPLSLNVTGTVPAAPELVPALPGSATGKILKKELRRAAGA